MRAAIKTLGAKALCAVGADRGIAALNGRGREPLVLCYHRVVEDPSVHGLSAPAMLVSTRSLERQLDWIGRHYRWVALDEMCRGLDQGSRDSGRLAAVTFDDGYADVYHHAFPLLRRKGIPFAVFAVAEAVGGEALQVHDELHILLCSFEARWGRAALFERLLRCGLEERELPPLRSRGGALGLLQLKEELLRFSPRQRIDALIRDLRQDCAVPPEQLADLKPASWEMLLEMNAAGVIVGSHTLTHRVLPNESFPDILSELVTSKRVLELGLGAEVVHLAYPDGQFCPVTIEAARKAGYRYAYTTCHHRVPQFSLLTIPRRAFWEGSCADHSGAFSGAVCACWVRGVFDRDGGCAGAHAPRPWSGARELSGGLVS